MSARCRRSFLSAPASIKICSVSAYSASCPWPRSEPPQAAACRASSDRGSAPLSKSRRTVETRSVVRSPREHRAIPLGIAGVKVRAQFQQLEDKPVLAVVGRVVQRGGADDERLTLLRRAGPFQRGQFPMGFEDRDGSRLRVWVVLGGQQPIERGVLVVDHRFQLPWHAQSHSATVPHRTRAASAPPILDADVNLRATMT